MAFQMGDEWDNLFRASGLRTALERRANLEPSFAKMCLLEMGLGSVQLTPWPQTDTTFMSHMPVRGRIAPLFSEN